MIRYRVPARSAQPNQPHEVRILHIVDFVVGHQKMYFQSVIQELQEHPVPDGQLDYLRLKLRGVMDEARVCDLVVVAEGAYVGGRTSCALMRWSEAKNRWSRGARRLRQAGRGGLGGRL